MAHVGNSQMLVMNYGGAHSEQYRYLVCEHELVIEVYSPKPTRIGTSYPLKTQKRIKLALGDSCRIWDAVEKASVPQWRSFYEPSQIDMAVDGRTQWKIRYWNGESEFQCRGDGIYPAIKPIGAPTFDQSNAFNLLLNEITRLEQKSR